MVLCIVITEGRSRIELAETESLKSEIIYPLHLTAGSSIWVHVGEDHEITEDKLTVAIEEMWAKTPLVARRRGARGRARLDPLPPTVGANQAMQDQHTKISRRCKIVKQKSMYHMLFCHIMINLQSTKTESTESLHNQVFKTDGAQHPVGSSHRKRPLSERAGWKKKASDQPAD
jgi:hypothetical protein